MSDMSYDSNDYPRMVLACAQGRGVDEGFKLERELSAYQNAEMPEEPVYLFNWLEKHGSKEDIAYFDALAKRCARLAVELEAGKNATSATQGFHDTSGFYEDDALTAGKEKA